MNRIKIFLISLLIVLAGHLQAQHFLLAGEGRIDQVRLFWAPETTWPQDVLGVNIKRKSSGEWTKLNDEMLVPGTVLDKKITSTGLGSENIQRLTDKKKQLIQNSKLNEIETGKFIEFMGDEKMAKSISFMLNSDFDIALIAGFGYVDRNVPDNSGQYEYGLFYVTAEGESNSPDVTYQWTYGTEPTIDVSMEGEIKVNNKTIELTWEVDVESYRSYKVLNGFNIFRKEEGNDYGKLTDRPIWISMKEATSKLYYKDDQADPEKKYIYAAVPTTIFNTEGSFNEIEFEPVDTDANPSSPDLKKPSNDQGKLQLNWGFKQDDEPHIQGFYVQKKQKDGLRFKKVSELLPSDARTFAYSGLPEADDSHHHFKVIAVKPDGLELWSNPQAYLHKKQTQPTAPQNLKAEIKKEGAILKITLRWDKPNTNADHVSEYYVYTSRPDNEKIVKDMTLGKITLEEVEYTIYKNASSIYHFAVSAVNANYEESPLSNKVNVVVPSKSLSFVNIWPVAQNNNKITLNWEYTNDFQDLAGFRLYENGAIVQTETALNKDARQWVSVTLDPGTYEYEIEAITTSGVTSKRSKPRKFTVK